MVSPSPCSNSTDHHKRTGLIAPVLFFSCQVGEILLLLPSLIAVRHNQKIYQLLLPLNQSHEGLLGHKL
jgi:hypothetical protein